MKKIFLLFVTAISGWLSSQSFIQAYQDRANMVTQTNINANLTGFASFGVKTTGSLNNNNARAWLQSKYLSFGYTASQIAEQQFNVGSAVSKNLIVTKTGTLYPNTFVIICGHFDTINGPGVNDNGSGVSVILEIARILQNVPTEYSIKFINFSGEEQGLYGSQSYVNSVVNSTTPKMDIRLVFNIDQVGAVAGQTHNTIFCDVDQSTPTTNNAASQQMTQELANCTQLYSPLSTVFGPAYASDYIPFENNGEVITGFYEYNGSSNPYPHTSSDIYANLDPVYVYNVAKAAVGAAQHFAVASTTLLATSETSLSDQQSFSVFPNPAKNILHLNVPKSVRTFSFSVTDMSGKLVKTVINQRTVDVSELESGAYVGTLESDGVKSSAKFLIRQ